MKKLGVLLLLIIALASGGAWYVYHNADPKTQQQMKADASDLADNARREAIKTEIATRQALVDKYDKWLAAIKEKQSGGNPKLEGAYDGFSYDKGADYQARRDEEEQRIKDLNARLNPK
jgi:hypothetical protein